MEPTIFQRAEQVAYTFKRAEHVENILKRNEQIERIHTARKYLPKTTAWLHFQLLVKHVSSYT
jgi:hypothetical protein